MSLFEDFDAISSKQWKQQIQFELNGADYNDTLVWNSPEDIKVKPFYHRDDFDKVASPPQNATSFKICQDIFVHDLEKSIYRAQDNISRGADSIRFTIDNVDIDIVKLLESLPLDQINIYIKSAFLSQELIASVNNIAVKHNATIFICNDPLGHLAEDGNWFKSVNGDNFETLKQLASNAPSVGMISINGGLYQNAGANIVQQIAYTLAHGNEYFNRIGSTAKPYLLQISVGTNYFFEIAKLRAIRLLFDLVAKEYDHTAGCNILVTPTKRNKTLYDYNVNMLRTTTECMSAIIGGADTISNLPYDALYHKSNEFGERISR
ncbi:MAG TPA: methylmalonyl-CoA mutase family protein, partial [Flavobacterium sp.]|nr:methylmalonyl-CoA mutase family protein [Flavobacterium sp.]